MKRKILFALVIAVALMGVTAVFVSADESRTYPFRATDEIYIDTSRDQLLIDTSESSNHAGRFSFKLVMNVDSDDPQTPDNIEILMNEFIAFGLRYNDGVSEHFRFVQGFNAEGLGVLVGFTTIFNQPLWGWTIVDTTQSPILSDVTMVGLNSPIEIFEGTLVSIESITMTTAVIPPSNIADTEADVYYRAIYQLYDWQTPPEQGAYDLVDFYKQLTNAYMTSLDALWGAQWSHMHNYLAVFFGTFLVASLASWVIYYIKRRR